MKLLLTLLFAIAFALIFQRRRVAAFVGERRVQRWSKMPDDLLGRLFAMSDALQEEQGRVDLIFGDTIDGVHFDFLFSGANGRLQLRISGPRRRYRFAAHDRPGPLWLDVAAPMDRDEEPGLENPALWQYDRSAEGWTSATDATAHRDGVALADVFLRDWRNHLDPRVQEKRLAAWRKTMAKIDRAALRRFVVILARSREDAADTAIAAIAARWDEVAATWHLIPVTEPARVALAKQRILDALRDTGLIVEFDFKDYDVGYLGPILLAGLPFAGPLLASLPDGRDITEKLVVFDRACQRYGYRLVQLETPFDDFTAAVVATNEIDEVQVLAANLGLGRVATVDRVGS